MTDQNFGPNNCRNCRHVGVVEQGTKLVCRWEKNFFPPAVWRARCWGKNAPDTHENYARDCAQYEDQR